MNRTKRLVLAFAVVVVGCGSPPTPSTDAVSTSGPATNDPADVGQAPPIETSRDGLTVSVAFDRAEVEPGGTVMVGVSVRNDRPTPVIVGLGSCGAPATVFAELAVPWEPEGQAWADMAGEFKEFALRNGQAPGIVPADRPIRVDAVARPCPQEPGELTLQPGATARGTLTWTAELVRGVPALPGDVPVRVEVAYDRPNPVPTPNCDPICGSTVLLWKGLTAEGSIRVAGDAPGVVTAGQALDALLADARFAAWLPLQPSSTWSNANLFLQSSPDGGGIVPPGPSWEIDLFREMGVPRNWAIGFVDAFSGEVRNIEFCNDPCDR
jgi:hypothetical protein